MKPVAARVSALVRDLQLQPHPEGGYYRETHRSDQSVLRPGQGRPRNASTAIYYLLDGSAYSAWHRIASDEVWHFYAGSRLHVHVLLDEGRLVTHRLGNALAEQDTVFQALIPAGRWFAAELPDPDSFALAGCTVAPGFEFSEFELAGAADLARWQDRHPDLIRRLLRRT